MFLLSIIPISTFVFYLIEVKELGKKENIFFLILVGQIGFMYIAADKDIYDLRNDKSQNAIKKITLIKGNMDIFCDKQFQFITRTSSSTILMTSSKSELYLKKRIIVINNSDISTMTLEETLTEKKEFTFSSLISTK